MKHENHYETKESSIKFSNLRRKSTWKIVLDGQKHHFLRHSVDNRILIKIVRENYGNFRNSRSRSTPGQLTFTNCPTAYVSGKGE